MGWHLRKIECPRPRANRCGTACPRYGHIRTAATGRLADARYGIRSPNGFAEAWRPYIRAGWELASIDQSNHDERWREASVHYHDALLSCGDELFIRSREPAWRLSRSRTIVYESTRGPAFPHDQFGLDRSDELRAYIERTTRISWGEFEFEGNVRHLDHETDDAPALIDLGRQAMQYVPKFRKGSTLASRRIAGCENLLHRMEELYRRDGPFTTADARDAVTSVRDLSYAICPIMRVRQVAHEIGNNSSRAKARLDYWDDRLNDLSAEDLDAVRTA